MNHTYILSSFFFNDTATTEIYTLSLHDALPIFDPTSTTLNMPGPIKITAAIVDWHGAASKNLVVTFTNVTDPNKVSQDRKSTRLNSSHLVISYAVFCLKKKKNHSLIVSCNPTKV